MNEQDLRERLEFTVATDLGAPPIDPTADLRRGRSRLRRNRIATGVAAVTSVAAVAALGLQLVPASSADRQDTAPATRPTTSPAVADVKTRQQQASRLANETLKKLDLVAHRHIDPGLKYSKQTIAEAYSLPTASDSSSKPFGVGIGKRWQQNGEPRTARRGCVRRDAHAGGTRMVQARREAGDPGLGQPDLHDHDGPERPPDRHGEGRTDGEPARAVEGCVAGPVRTAGRPGRHRLRARDHQTVRDAAAAHRGGDRP